MIYRGSETKEISFPLGGIGTGCVGLAGNGRLVDWEIFNRPGKGGRNGFSFFCIKAESGQDAENLKVEDARVLNGDLHPPYIGRYNTRLYQGYGYGPDRTEMAGAPHFRDVEFKGEFPVAELGFLDETFPGKVKMTAFNPFIPLNDKDSSIPGAFFEIEVDNTAGREMAYTICLVLNNPLKKGSRYNRYGRKEYSQSEGRQEIHFISLGAEGISESDADFGDMCIATDSSSISYQEYWFRGSWFDNLGVFWRDFTAPGAFKNRSYSEPARPGQQDSCTLAVRIKVPSGEKGRARFVITWNFPNCYNYWNPEKKSCEGDCCCNGPSGMWKNYYATIFNSSEESAVYALTNWDRLYRQTMMFKDALFSSSIPEYVKDAVSANISILKTPTCLRLEDGSFYGFEGCGCVEGCCEGSCTHVWNYAYALPFLFPALERSMRSLNYKYNIDENGAMAFRLQLPLGRKRWGFRPCVDGQFGEIIKAYRDWKISGDTRWISTIWEQIKKILEYAWNENNIDRWDFDRDGVLEGSQHHTLDMELFGPNPWLTGYYLAALKAASEMADHFGEHEKAAEYRELFQKGQKWVDENLFNGSYYQQSLDLKDRSVLEPFKEVRSIIGPPIGEAYWNSEAGEIKYQSGEGCMTDQVIAQWHANISGLGDIFGKEQRRKALEAIYKYNFKKNLRNHFNPCRIYALNDEAGVAIGDWPEGTYKPVVPMPYSEETWSGCEYQVAAHMIQEGLEDKGLEIVKAVRDRYDGEKRNPWNEFECGSNYARSMASYSLLPALSGFEFDMVEKMVGFSPVVTGNNNLFAGNGLPAENNGFRCFWSLDPGWGDFEASKDEAKLKVLYGKLEIKTLKLGFLKGSAVKSAALVKTAAPDKAEAMNITTALDKAGAMNKTAAPDKMAALDKTAVNYRQESESIVFDTPLLINEGEMLVVYIGGQNR